MLLRAIFCGYVVGWQRSPFGDEIDYHGLATSVAAGEGLVLQSGERTARRPPLYPVALGLLYKITGPRPELARGLQVALGGLIVWLVFLVAGRYFSRRTAWIAAMLCAFNPFLIFISAYILTENLYIVLLLLALLIIPRSTDMLGAWPRVIAAGMVVGLGSLSRPTAFGFGLWVVASLVLISGGSFRDKVVRGSLFLLLIIATLLPWAARNHGVFGKWIFFTTHGGITFYQGNNPKVLDIPQYRGGVAPLHALPGIGDIGKLDIVDADETAWALGKQFLRENKAQVPVLVWRKFQRFWRLHSDAGMSGVKSGWWWSKGSFLGRLAASLDAGFVYAVIVVPLFIVGLIITYRRWRSLSFLYGLILLHTWTALVFYGSLRMRIPIEPVIVIFAAEAACRLWRGIKGDRSAIFAAHTDRSSSQSPQ